MSSVEWWQRIRSKLRPSKKKDGERAGAEGKTEAVAQDWPQSDERSVFAAALAPDITREQPSYDTRIQDALLSAASGSEPVSMASTAVSGGQHGGTIIFAPSTSLNTPGLLPRVTQPASGQSVYVSEIQPAPQMVTNPAYERQSQDGAAVTAPAGPAPRAQETQPSAEAPAPAAADPQAKLTAAALGTHVTLSESVVRTHRSHRKIHFIKNWLNEADTETDKSAQGPSISPQGPPLPPRHSGTSDGSRPEPALPQPAPSPQRPDTGRGPPLPPQQPFVTVRHSPVSHVTEPSPTARSSPQAGSSSTAHRAQLPHVQALPHTVAQGVAQVGTGVGQQPHGVAMGTATPALLPQGVVTHVSPQQASSPQPYQQPTQVVFPLPYAHLQPAQQLAHAPPQPLVPYVAWVTHAQHQRPHHVLPVAQSPPPPQTPFLPQQPTPMQQLHHTPLTDPRYPLQPQQSQQALRSAVDAAAAAAFAAAGGAGPSNLFDAVHAVAVAHRQGQRPPGDDTEQLEAFLPSAVTTMTVTSLVEGPEIPKRVEVPSVSSAVLASPSTSRPIDPSPPPGMRLPSAAPHESTKTIAVAGHCPEDMAAQRWSVDDFILQRKLYEGALSVICHAQHKRSGRHVALKIYKRSRLREMERFQLAREICLHIRILHPHILSLYAAWKDSKYVYLVLEWAPHGNLFELLVSRGGKLPEIEAARHIIRPLLTSLAFLHSHSWLHRDIKLENVLLDAQGMVKLCDFGLAIDQKFEQANTRLGTFGYFAPEVLDCPLKKGPFDFKGEPGVPTYGCKVDVWSMGVMSYELLTGKAPFAASSAAKIIEAIRSREVQYPAWLSTGARSFLSAALVRDPEQRATAEQLLQHPWILACCGVGQVPPPAPPPSPPQGAGGAQAGPSAHESSTGGSQSTPQNTPRDPS